MTNHDPIDPESLFAAWAAHAEREESFARTLERHPEHAEEFRRMRSDLELFKDQHIGRPEILWGGTTAPSACLDPVAQPNASVARKRQRAS